MATTSLTRRKVSRPLTTLEQAFLSFYLGERGRCQGNATVSYQQAQHAAGFPMSQAGPASSSAHKLLHSKRIANRIGRALASRTVTEAEITGRLSDLLLTPRSDWEKGIINASDVIKAAEVLGRLKRIWADPLEAAIVRQVQRMAARTMPAEVQALMEEGEPEEGLEEMRRGHGRGQGVPVPVALQAKRSIRGRQLQPARTRRARSTAIEVEAQVISEPREAEAGHDAVQHEAMTQRSMEEGEQQPLASSPGEAPRRGPAPRPLHPRPTTKR